MNSLLLMKVFRFSLEELGSNIYVFPILSSIDQGIKCPMLHPYMHFIIRSCQAVDDTECKHSQLVHMQRKIRSESYESLFLLSTRARNKLFLHVLRHLVCPLLTLLLLDLCLVVALGVFVFETLASWRLRRERIYFLVI